MTDIDFSNEGLSERIVSDAPVEDAPVEAEAPVEEVVDTPEDSTPLADAPVDEPAGDVDPYVSRYEEAQKLIGRQGSELGEMRRQLAELQAAQQQAYEEPEEEYDPFPSAAPQTQNELLEWAATPENAVEAYQFAAQYAPHLVPDVLAEVQFHDPALAKRMELDVYQRMVEAQVAPVQQQYQQSTQQAQAAQVVDHHFQQIGGDDTLRGEVAQILEEEPWLISELTPDAIQRGLRAATRMAQQARAVATTHAQAQVTQQGIAKRQHAAVETGTAGAAPTPEDLSAEDSIRAGIFADDQRRRELF